MATSKKKSSKKSVAKPAAKPRAATRSSAKKAGEGSTSPRAKRRAPARDALTADERQKLLRPRDLDLLDDVLRAWVASPGLKVDGYSVARLRSLADKARKAREREAALLARHAEQLRPINDARLLAEDAAWRGILEVKATVAFRARNDAALGERFSFLDEAFRTPRKKPEGDGPQADDPPPGGS